MNWSYVWENLLNLLVYDPQQPLLFNSGAFLLFFTVLVLGYLFVFRSARQRTIYLLFFSLYFYYKSSGIFVLLLMGTIGLNYLLAFPLAQQRGTKIGRQLLFGGVVLNLIPLFYFKYTNFFLENVAWLSGQSFSPLSLILPVGISFFTFQTISYLADVYRGDIEPCGDLLDFGFYLSFFPQLVAGPIVRASEFLPQLHQRIVYQPAVSSEEVSQDPTPTMVVQRQDFGQALFLILKGFIKKAILADYLAQYGDIVFEHPAGYSGFENLIAMYSYTLQIYCDFSGYSDMAIGLALLLGYRLSENFRSPYQSLSITEFWRRWHISLSFWLRDYIYIALGGNRKGLQRQYLFLMITMLVGGWWHGASWKFVFWGGMHGLALVLHKFWLSWKKEQAGKPWFEAIPTWLSKPLAWLLTFHFVAVLWLYFRAKDFETASLMLWRMISDWNLAMLPAFWAVRPLVLVMLAVGLLLHFTKIKDKLAAAEYFGNIPLWAKALVFLGLIQLSLQLRGAGVAPFIYFQF